MDFRATHVQFEPDGTKALFRTISQDFSSYEEETNTYSLNRSPHVRKVPFLITPGHALQPLPPQTSVIVPNQTDIIEFGLK